MTDHPARFIDDELLALAQLAAPGLTPGYGHGWIDTAEPITIAC
jgi:hypothetical protein